MSLDALTPNAISTMFRSTQPREPVVQLIEVKQMPTPDGAAPKMKCALAAVRARSSPSLTAAAPRRALLSDGKHFAAAVITSESAKLIFGEQVQVNQLIVLKNYLLTQVGAGKTRAIVVMDMKGVPVEEGAELTKLGGAR
jgi:hypothetical protein